MHRFVSSLFVAAVLLGCLPFAPVQAQTNPAEPADFPHILRWDLVPKWIKWADPKADISWPPDDGCKSPPIPRSLTAGQMVDRFGGDNGTFFSPRGESFRARAVPYVCAQMDYRIYRVVKPVAVKSCKAAPWFGEPGGAVQVQTAESAAKLVADGTITEVSHAVGGSGGPTPQCGRP